jgi:solute carrier family 39 (zinc transporter), member 1/2/3
MTLSTSTVAALKAASKEDVLCYYALSSNDYNGQLGVRISSIFVILMVSSAFTVFPVILRNTRTWRVPHGIYLFARYFGTGVILATAFIHLLDPAYKRIGPMTCVGSSGNWARYSWCAAIVLTSIVVIFLMDLAAEIYVEQKYDVFRDESAMAAISTATPRQSISTLQITLDPSKTNSTPSQGRQIRSLLKQNVPSVNKSQLFSSRSSESSFIQSLLG